VTDHTPFNPFLLRLVPSFPLSDFFLTPRSSLREKSSLFIPGDLDFGFVCAPGPGVLLDGFSMYASFFFCYRLTLPPLPTASPSTPHPPPLRNGPTRRCSTARSSPFTIRLCVDCVSFMQESCVSAADAQRPTNLCLFRRTKTTFAQARREGMLTEERAE